MKKALLKALANFCWTSGLTLLFFAADRGTKILAERYLSTGDVVIFPDFLRFHLTYNENLALSIPFPLLAQIIISIIFLGVLGWYFLLTHPPKKFWDILIVSAIFGGALGNLIDRIISGKVVDFIAVWRFPVFNLADTLLFLGIAAFVIKEFVKNKKGKS